MIADGNHRASLFDLNLCTTPAGAPGVSFVWQLEGSDARLSYILSKTDSAGRPNHFAIQFTKRWAYDWDGKDIVWFDEHREELLNTRVLITTREGVLTWITPLAREQEEGTGNAEQGTEEDENDEFSLDSILSAKHDGDPGKAVFVRLVVDETKRTDLPESVEPTCEEALALFYSITNGTPKFDAELIWTVLAEKVGPMQMDFGEAEWAKMIKLIRHLKSFSGVVAV